MTQKLTVQAQNRQGLLPAEIVKHGRDKVCENTHMVRHTTHIDCGSKMGLLLRGV
jgi:hypothetical protein